MSNSIVSLPVVHLCEDCANEILTIGFSTELPYGTLCCYCATALRPHIPLVLLECESLVGESPYAFRTYYSNGDKEFVGVIWAGSWAGAWLLARERNLNERVVEQLLNEPFPTTPSQLVKAKKYVEAAHTLCYLASLLQRNYPNRVGELLQDTGALHELLHKVTHGRYASAQTSRTIVRDLRFLENLAPGYQPLS